MECPQIPYLGYSSFSRRLHDRIGGQRVPLLGSLELTFRCNLRCQHCYVACGHQGLPGKQELTYPEIQILLDQVAYEGCLWFLITGGEPLLRKDFVDIYTYAKRKGLLITLFTNGTLLTPRLADLLAEWRPFSIEITLYGYTQATYEKVTGIPGSHARCMRGIELLLERGLPLKLKTMVMTLNQHELSEMQAFADRLGVEFHYDAMLNAGVDGDSRPKELRLAPQQVVQLDLADSQRMEAWKSFSRRYLGARPDERYLYQCGAGLDSFHIDPYGQLSLCITSRWPSYDLRQGSFREGWSQFLPQVRFQPSSGESECSRCELDALCGQCPGWAKMEQGDLLDRVDYLCQVAHLREQAFGFVRLQEIA